MLNFVSDFEVLHCESEWEALLTENRLIKDIHPRFNARLTDDKTFPYLAVTMRDDFPGVFVTREPGHERFKGAKILGPFTSSYALRESVQILQKVFKLPDLQRWTSVRRTPSGPTSGRACSTRSSSAPRPAGRRCPKRLTAATSTASSASSPASGASDDAGAEAGHGDRLARVGLRGGRRAPRPDQGAGEARSPR